MQTLSTTPGAGGTVKSIPEDFIVKEIIANGKTLELDTNYSAQALGQEEPADAKFTTFVLQKKNWNTIQAVTTIAKKLAHGKGSIGYSGVKDRASVSVQLASIFGSTPEQVLAQNVKDVKINGAWKSNGVEMGSNIGNAFDVVIRNPTNKEHAEKTIEELNGRMPNYFDRQRFGSRLNNARIGYLILKQDFNAALTAFLTDTENEDNQNAIEARKKLLGDGNYKEALSGFPRYLAAERMAINYMAEYDNPANAIRKIPKGIQLLFIHALEAFIYNSAVAQRIRERDFSSNVYLKQNFFGFPSDERSSEPGFACELLPGYETKKEDISDYAKEVMERIDITPEEFKIKSMPELSMRGVARSILAPVKDFRCNAEEDIKLSFSIPSGSYATILLNEITKSNDNYMDLVKVN